MLGTLGPATPADESFADTGVSFLTEGCGVGALLPLTDGTSGFETAINSGTDGVRTH